MKLRIASVAICLVANSAWTDPYQDQIPNLAELKGLLYYSPGIAVLGDALYNNTSANGLWSYKECMVVVEDIDEEIRDEITRDDIENWVKNRLSNLGIRVVRWEDIKSTRPLGESDLDRLVFTDFTTRTVGVDTTAIKMESGTTSVWVDMRVDRGGFFAPGFFRAGTIWDSGVLTVTGSARSVKDQIRDSINRMLDKFEKDWRLANASKTSAGAGLGGASHAASRRYRAFTNRLEDGQ